MLMMGSLFDLVHRPHKIKQPDSLTTLGAVKLAQGISCGIAYLHAKSLVHADLKSPNILISQSPTGNDAGYVPRICDFGHAAVRAVPSPHSRICTPQWAAPEVLRYESLGPAADIFSFGVIFWEMLACRVPHSDLSFGQVQASVGWGELTPDISELPPHPEPLSRLLASCLRFAPVDRPTAKQLNKQLMRLPHDVQRDAEKQLWTFFWGCQEAKPAAHWTNNSPPMAETSLGELTTTPETPSKQSSWNPAALLRDAVARICSQ